MNKIIIDELIKGFRTRGSKSKKQKAMEMLQDLFASYSFDLRLFCVTYHLTDKEITQFLSYLLYCIYYNEIVHTQLPKNLEFYFLTLLTEIISTKWIKHLLPRKKLPLIAFCKSYLREGSWLILKAIDHTNNLFTHSPNTLDIQLKLPILIDKIIALPLEKLKESFAPYRNQNYTSEELDAFFKLFSFNFPLPDLIKLFDNPTLASPEQLNFLINTVLGLCENLYAYFREPSLYRSGLTRMVYTLSTRGINFDQMPWLPSVLEGLQSLTQHLKLNLKDFPIIIFDQAPNRELSKNRIFVQKQAKKYSATIWHLSHEEIIRLAKKLKVLHWIKSSRKRYFGYGGARNCTFFLAPVIHQAFQKGSRTYAELIKRDDLKILFNESVLGKTAQDSILHLGEDDIFIPICNFYSDTLFAAKHKNLYFQRFSLEIGRSTLNINAKLDLKNLLSNPSILYSSTVWKDTPSIAGMKAMLTKPVFCLPLPFGHEERHVSTPISLSPSFEQPIIHLGGTRFPKHLIPISPLDGILKYLKCYLTYCIEISMVMQLVDPANLYGRCILPWNDPEVPGISCLGDLLEYAKQPKVQKELQKRFWDNLTFAFTSEPSDENPLVMHLTDLANLESSLSAPAELKRFYKDVQNDARLFLEVGRNLIQNKKLKNKPVKSPLTSSFLLLLNHIFDGSMT